MRKLLVLPAARGKPKALKAFITALNIDFKSVSSGTDQTATISARELLRPIKDDEQCKTTL